MAKKIINIRLEGGLGDVLLGNRFIPAIKEKHPNSFVHAFLDSEGKTFQKESLEILYPSFYDKLTIITHKKYKKFVVDCQFGEDETFKGCIENVPDEFIEKMMDGDLFYDLHIDSLKWLNYDFNWLRYYRNFPYPEKEPIYKSEKNIVFHVLSTSKNDHGLEQEYVEQLILKVSSHLPCRIISTPETRFFYKNLEGKSNIEIIDTTLQGAFEVISSATCIFSIDSGFKYVGYGYGIPTYCMSKQVISPGVPFPSHQIRWMPFPETCFPLNFDAAYLARLLIQTVFEQGTIISPSLDSFDFRMIRRDYKVNLQKSQ